MSANLIARVYRKLSRPIYRYLEIDNVTGLPITRRADLVRLGSAYGGWSIPASLLSANSICYCAGCGEDITFDLELIERFRCRVYGFDPTPRAIAHVAMTAAGNALYLFDPIGLWKEDATLKFFEPRDPTHVSHSLMNLQKTDGYFEAPVRRLAAIMKKNGHARLDLLKLDIEGAEYAVLDTILEDRIPIGILCVEFDEYFQPLDQDYRARIRQAIDRLTAADFVMTDTEGNGNYTFVHSPTA